MSASVQAAGPMLSCCPLRRRRSPLRAGVYIQLHRARSVWTHSRAERAHLNARDEEKPVTLQEFHLNVADYHTSDSGHDSRSNSSNLLFKHAPWHTGHGCDVGNQGIVDSLRAVFPTLALSPDLGMGRSLVRRSSVAKRKVFSRAAVSVRAYVTTVLPLQRVGERL